MVSIAPGTATLAQHPELRSENHLKPQCPKSQIRQVPVPAPQTCRVAGDPTSPTEAKEGHALPLRPGVMQQLPSSPRILLAMGSLCLPAPARNVLRGCRGSIRLGCWRLILTLQEPQSSQDSQWGGGRGETWTMGTPAWVQLAGRNLE